jgi:hypothetical protein
MHDLTLFQLFTVFTYYNVSRYILFTNYIQSLQVPIPVRSDYKTGSLDHSAAGCQTKHSRNQSIFLPPLLTSSIQGCIQIESGSVRFSECVNYGV